MKRLLIAMIIITSATILFCAQRNETARAIQANADCHELWRAQVQRLEQLQAEREQLRNSVREAKRQAEAEGPAVVVDELAKEFAASGLKNPSADKAERLLAELGFNWNSAGNWLIVSKTSLPNISVPAFRDAKLTDAARAALAMTPGEQASIEAEAQRLTAEYSSWLRANVRREEPSGDVLAKYVLTNDPPFSASSSNAFAGVVYSTLGQQRGELLQRYAWNWMNSLGMFDANRAYTQPTSMTVRRQGKYLMLNLQQAMGMMSCGITPSQPFPEAFHPLFPGGWKELAEREGFELPEQFREK